MATNKVVFSGNTLIDLTDTTATAADVASGKYFYTNAGVRTLGTASGGGGTKGKYWYQGWQAELVQSHLNQKVYLKDTEYNGWTPSTTAKAINSYPSSSTYYQVNNIHMDDEWLPFFIVRFLFVPVYTGTPSGARVKRLAYFLRYSPEWRKTTLAHAQNDTWTVGTDTAIQFGGLYANASNVDTFSTSSFAYGVYAATSNSGVHAVNGGGNADYADYFRLQVKVNARCNTNYFTTTNAGLIDQTNSYYQIIVEEWKAKNIYGTDKNEQFWNWYYNGTNN